MMKKMENKKVIKKILLLILTLPLAIIRLNIEKD